MKNSYKEYTTGNRSRKPSSQNMCAKTPNNTTLDNMEIIRFMIPLKKENPYKLHRFFECFSSGLKKNIQSGFSLIEVMVIATIIGVLATMAITRFHYQQARARQKEGLRLMSSYYMSAQSVHAEFQRYPGNFVQTGFQPKGAIKYRITVVDGNDITAPENDDNCINTGATCDCGGSCSNYKTWQENTAGVVGSSTGPIAMSLGSCSALATADHTFIAGASAVISTSATEMNSFIINQNKAITTCREGMD